MATRRWMFVGASLLLIALVARPCVISPVRKLWSKRPGSTSELFAFEKNGTVGFISPSGTVVIKPTIVEPIEDVGDFSNGRARVEHQGYIDESGRNVIEGKDWYLSDFSDGLARVTVADPGQKYGYATLFLDVTGKVVAKAPAFRVREFSEGLAAFEAEGKPALRKFEPGDIVYRDYPGLKGFIDRLGNVVIKPAFAEVGPFVDHLARAVVDGYCHLAEADGSWEGTPTTGVASSCGGAPADAVSPCPVGFINPAGEFVVKPEFESARDFRDSLAAVRVRGKWGFIGTDGAMVIAPRFELAQSFQEGLAAVRLGGKWGFVDRTGALAIQPRFEAVEPFSASLAIAYEGTRPFYVDRNGQTKITGPFREATPFVHGLAAVLLSEHRVCYINRSGKTVFTYDRR